ncbi:MAG: hypothetical protein V3V11_10305, partial [Vicinamibacteria bacterium]
HRLRGVSCRHHRGAVEGEGAGSQRAYLGRTVRGDRKTLALGEAVQETGSFIHHAQIERRHGFPRTAGTLRRDCPS